MKSKKVWKLFWTIIFINIMICDSFAEQIQDPCRGVTALLNITNRPTVADSACVVPFQKVVLETGYQYQQLTHSAGYEQNFPSAEYRLGLPANNELAVTLPNHIDQSKASGSTAMIVGLKHEIGYTKHWLYAVEAIGTLPNGSAMFGNKKAGAAFNGIVSYTFNPKFNVTLMLGITTETQPSHEGGGRFQSINPDLVFTFTPVEKLDLFVEVYGQSKTAPGEGSGFNSDAGFLYLYLKNLALDFEVGQRISGNLNGFNHYIGTGLSILFS